MLSKRKKSEASKLQAVFASQNLICGHGHQVKGGVGGKMETLIKMKPKYAF